MVKFAASARGLMQAGRDEVITRLKTKMYKFQWKDHTIPETVGDIPDDLLKSFVNAMIVEVNDTENDISQEAARGALLFLAQFVLFVAIRSAFTRGDLSLEVVTGTASRFSRLTRDKKAFITQLENMQFNRVLLDTWNKLCIGTEGMQPEKMKGYIQTVLGRIGVEGSATRLASAFNKLSAEYRHTDDADSVIRALLNTGVIDDSRAKVRAARVALYELIEDRGYRDSNIMALWSRIAWRAPKTQCKECKKVKSPLFWCYQPKGLPIPTVYPEPWDTSQNSYINLFNSLADSHMVTLCFNCYKNTCTETIRSMKGPRAGQEDGRVAQAVALFDETVKMVEGALDWNQDEIETHRKWVELVSPRDSMVSNITNKAEAVMEYMYT
jgi:hypothetical protein